MDIRWGYHNIQIKQGDQWKAAFKMNQGLFEPTVMFFGLCNLPSTFQAMMNSIFADMILEEWLLIYMNDILIVSPNEQTDRERTERVLQRLADHNLYLKPEKCVFNTEQVEFLGLDLTPGKIGMDKEKLKGIKDWLTPTTIKQTRSFLRFANFYQKFIDHYFEHT
jgi:hypothetical protein